MKYIYVVAYKTQEGPIAFIHNRIDAKDDNAAYTKGAKKLGSLTEGQFLNDYVIPVREPKAGEVAVSESNETIKEA